MSSLKNILWLEDISTDDIKQVGEKNASLGELYNGLEKSEISVPNGFVITRSVYRDHISSIDLKQEIKDHLLDLDVNDEEQIRQAGKKIRKKIYKSNLSKEVVDQIKQAYDNLKKNADTKEVAVRTSVVAEDLPQESFSGKVDSFLNISTKKYLIRSAKKAMASLFSDRAIKYRIREGFDHLSMECAVGVQLMVDAQEGQSGTITTLEQDSGYEGVTVIKSSYGFGGYVQKGKIEPDQFYVFKEGLKKGKTAVINKHCGSKEKKLIKGKNRYTKQKRVKKADRQQLSLDEDEVAHLAELAGQIEDHFGCPQYIEWSKDIEGQFYILQAREEVSTTETEGNVVEEYELKQTGKVLLRGISVGKGIGSGKVRVLDSPDEEFNQGDVLVAEKTDQSWESIIRKASAVVTDKGSRTGHAAIAARELGTPAVLGTEKATKRLKNEKEITVDCTQGADGFIYRDSLPFEVHRRHIESSVETGTKIMLNISNPDNAFHLRKYPNDGVGLARSEFIFNNSVKIHPLAAINYEDQPSKIQSQIDEISGRYEDKPQYCIDKLAEGIGKTAAAFYPKKTIIRLSDFTSDEYSQLVGGEHYEPQEDNPMLGWRGASRYYSEKYKPAFEIECKAIKKAIDKWGLDNVVVMVPFCRTPQEGRKVLDTMTEFGLDQKDVDVYAMCELPSNVVLADKFARIFDGISIGSNDLTQLVLGVDRNSKDLNRLYNENNPAVKKMIKDVIKAAHKYEKPVSICGQAPSDSLEFSEFLVRSGIDSISLNPDSLVKVKNHIADIEKTVGNTGDKTNSRLLLLLVALGVISAVVILMGNSCSTNLTRNYQDDQKVTDYTPAEIRKKAKKQAEKHQQKELEETMLPLKIRDLGEFDIKYPYGWEVVQKDQELILEDPQSDKYIKLYNSSVEQDLKSYSRSFTNTSTIAVDERQGFKFSTSSVVTSEAATTTEQLYKVNIRTNTSTIENTFQTDTTITDLLIIESNNQEQLDRVVDTINFN